MRASWQVDGITIARPFVEEEITWEDRKQKTTKEPGLLFS
jgi:hypothetical protein